MKNHFLFYFLLISGFSFGQTRVQFQYDTEGNQTARVICLTCNAKTAKDSIVTSKTLVESDMIKDAVHEQISYYPNPVRNELYIKWINEDSKYVIGISVVSISGQSIQQYQYTKESITAAIPFSNYPNGFYNVVLLYNNGEKKTLKIVKK